MFALFSYDEERAAQVDWKKAREVKIPSVEHIACTRLVSNPVHSLAVMDVGVCNAVEYRDFGGNVDLRMNLDSRLRTAEFSPPEQRQAKIYGRGINRLKFTVQFKFLCHQSWLSLGYHQRRKILKNTCVAKRICLGKRCPYDGSISETEVVRMFRKGRGDVCKFSETITAVQLSIHNRK